MTGKVEKSELQHGVTVAGFSWLEICHDFADNTLPRQNIELDQRYAAGRQAMLRAAIPITRKPQLEQQNRRPDGPAVALLLMARAKELQTWAVRCLSTRHTGKRPGLSFFAETG